MFKSVFVPVFLLNSGKADSLTFDKSSSFYGVELTLPQISRVSKSDSKYWFFTLVSLLIFLASAFPYLFAMGLLVFRELAIKFYGWAILSLLMAFTIYFIGRKLRESYGAKTFINTDDYYEYSVRFGKTEKIKKDTVVSIEIVYPRNEIPFAKGSRKSVVIRSMDQKMQVPLWQFPNEKVLSTYFEALSNDINDEYLDAFTKYGIDNFTLIRKLLRRRWVLFSLSIIGIYTFLALWSAFAIMIAGQNSIYTESFFIHNPDYARFDPSYRWQPPSSEFIFGTDHLGRDIFARLVWGTLLTLSISIFVAIIQITLIFVLGIISALSSKISDIIERVGDILIVFPSFIPIILFATVLNPFHFSLHGGYYLSVFLGLSLFTWPEGVRIFKSEIAYVESHEYVLVSKIFGATKFRIFWKHVLPKVLPSILILFIYAFGDVIMGITVLGLIQLGGPSTTITWGLDLEKAILFIPDYLEIWWPIVFPAIWVSGIIIALTMLSDNIRDLTLGRESRISSHGGK